MCIKVKVIAEICFKGENLETEKTIEHTETLYRTFSIKEKKGGGIEIEIKKQVFAEMKRNFPKHIWKKRRFSITELEIKKISEE